MGKERGDISENLRCEDAPSKISWPYYICTFFTTLFASLLAVVMFWSFMTQQLDQKGCSMSYMRPIFSRFAGFNHEHTRFAKRYSLYLYREGVVDEDSRVKGVPILFVPGNAGSYKQVRSLAAYAAVHYQDFINGKGQARQNGKQPLDFFSLDFNEEFAAFHGKTLVEQAEYLNDAISYILALYQTPHLSMCDSSLPAPSSVILVGHSMGGIVARTIFTLPNYQRGSVNTIITLATPHARAPLSFDADIVETYKVVNDYWRHAYSQTQAISNPLWDVTLISIAGGGLDSTVPSDYATLASIVPLTHGFTVFTSTIPGVWASMDHLAITWCDQLRKNIVVTLYDLIDATRTTQTRPRTERMRAFRKQLLTGLEESNDRDLLQTHYPVIAEVNSTVLIPPGNRLVLGKRGDLLFHDAKTYLMPIPKSKDFEHLNLITNQYLTSPESASMRVMICRIHSSLPAFEIQNISMLTDLPIDDTGSILFTCKNAALDAVLLPASTSENNQPFDHFFVKDSNHRTDNSPPFSFLRYHRKTLEDFEIAVISIERPTTSRSWVLAEFSSRSSASTQDHSPSSAVLSPQSRVALTKESILFEIQLPSVYSCLLAYKLQIKSISAKDTAEIFSPLLRQYIPEPFESKFFVNVQEADINTHGAAPYVPHSLNAQGGVQGLSFQIWSDPTSNSSRDVSIQIDFTGSVGKLWMRYRAMLAVFPLIIVALVVEKQLRIYNNTGLYVSFSEAMELCLRSSIPMFLLALVSCTLALSSRQFDGTSLARKPKSPNDIVASRLVASQSQIFFGLEDPFFWFLAPLFGVMSVGACVILHLAMLALTGIFSTIFSRLKGYSTTAPNRSSDGLLAGSRGWRIISITILLFSVATMIPYQLLFIVLCVIQAATCVRALALLRKTKHLKVSVDFYNYAQSVLMLMLWILPINIPTLIVWVHNLSVHPLVPFSSHHDILSIIPFVLLVETINNGSMIPRLRSPLQKITSTLFIVLAVYTAVCGLSSAYFLHSVANFICLWLALVHLSANGLNLPYLKKNINHNSNQGVAVRDKKER